MLIPVYLIIMLFKYGRKHCRQFHIKIKEIDHVADPKVRAIIDIGGQDVKGISVDQDGTVLNFAMNDKCAAGTGRFFESMANLPQFCYSRQ